MSVQQVAFRNGWDWIVGGWGLFVKNPALWIIMVVLFVLIAFALSLIPLLGPLAFNVIAPALTGGMLYAARELDQGRGMEIGHLFRAFNDSSRTRPMLTLGALMLGFSLVVTILGALVLGSLVGQSMDADPEAVMQQAFGAGALLALLVILLCGLVIAMMLYFGIPLVMFGGERPIPALRSSVSACITNFMPLLLLGAIYLVLGLVASIPLGLGFLVLIPVMIGATYCSYRDVYAQ